MGGPRNTHEATFAVPAIVTRGRPDGTLTAAAVSRSPYQRPYDDGTFAASSAASSLASSAGVGVAVTWNFLVGV